MTVRTESAVEDTIATALPAAKKGPLARLADGVGNLFARVTGKKPSEPDPTPRPSPDQTIELSADDIFAEASAPPPIPKAKS